MRIAIPLLFSATLLMFLFCGCNNIVREEETTDVNETVIQTIEKSKPVTSGNLITKTKTDSEGNIHVEYHDSVGNLVEEYVWNNNDTIISHSIMRYTPDNKIQKKEEIHPADNYSVITSYQYDGAGNLFKKTASSYINDRLSTTFIIDGDNNLIEHSKSTYENDLLAKVERFDKNDSLIEYSTYDYNESAQLIKHSVFDKDGNIIRYTLFEYNETLLVSEKYYSADDSLKNYNEYTYNDDGTKKSVISYDADGTLLAENYF